MISTIGWRKVASGFWGRFVATSLIVCVVGAASNPAFASVPVDQTPLTSQVTLPPNIMLVIDDSGSMAWDYMPDSEYLCDVVSGVWTTTCSATTDMYRSYAINGAYYNPNQIYQPPPTSTGVATGTKSVTVSTGNGGTYTAQVTTWSSAYNQSPSMTGAYDNPFSSYNATDNISTYTGGFKYYKVFSGSTAGTCSAGAYTSNGQSYGCYTTSTSGKKTTYTPQTLNCPSGYSASGSSSINSACSGSVNLFTFETPAVAIPAGTTSITYNLFYVAATAGDCATAQALSTSVTSNNCIDDDATRQNVANWFSYYRTRILMAKSGIMSAFSSLDGSYRVGFASINNGSGGNSTDKSDLTNTVGSGNYTDQSVGSYDLYLANIAPFNYTDSSGTTATVNGNTQKTNLWTWAAGLSPNNSTPTVSALAAIGQYYATQGAATGTTTGAWATMPSDPNYSSYKNTYFACRASYTILTTDGFWNQSYAGSTVAKKASNSAVNMTSSATGSKYSLAANTPPFAEGYGTNSSGATIGDTSSSPSETTLADVAFYYWSKDLQPNIGDEVPTNSADPAFWQHMTTFTMGLGFAPQTAKPASAMANNAASVFAWAQSLNNGQSASAISNFSWGTAASSSGGIENIADLAHAGVNGHGGFYSVSSPSDFQTGLQDALARAAQRLGSGASLAANSTQLTTGTDAFQATYYSGTWTGDLKEYSVDPTTGVIAQAFAWDAASLLPPNTAVTTATPLTAAGRTIYTHNASSSATSGYTKFVISSSGTLPTLSTTQLANLGSTDTARASMINYLRGDGSNEQRNKGIYRDRLTTVLGDIVDSQPVYEGAPSANQFYGQTFLGSSTYAAYVSNNASRNAMVWVAANDGMLHAFDATTGLEKYAYLPGAVLNDTTNPISNLANPLYGTSNSVPHTFFNDGMLTIADAYDGTKWHTVLVGTTGRGTAKAVYALDVTDPTTPSFLWERSAGDGVDTNSQYIGEVTGQPIIAQTGSGAGEWSVLIGNGYNSSSGAAALLQFNLFTGALTVHTTTATTTINYNVTSNMSTDTTTNNFTLTTSTTTTTGNGLAPPAVWEDSATNGISTKAWAGDLNGVVWQFVLNNIDTNGGTDDPTPSSAGTQVFHATDASSNGQPITGGMLAGADPTTGNVWLFFGTGRYLTTTDWSNLATQSWYGVIVENNSGTPLTCSTATPSTCGLRSALVQRQIIAEQAATTTQSAARVVTTDATATPVNNTASGGSNYQGWYIDLSEPQPNTSGPAGGDLATQQGERMVTPNQFEGNLLLGTTRLPLASDPCNPSGSGWIMAVSPFTGTNPSTSFFDLNGDGSVNGSDTVSINGKSVPAAGIGFSSLPNNPIFAGTAMMVSFNNGSNGSIATSGASGSVTRVSWRELINQ